MKIRTQLKAGGWTSNHNETLAVRTALKAGGVSLNHNEALAVRSTLKAGRIAYNHNETLQTRSALNAGRINLRAAVRTTPRKVDRLELLVVRAGLRAGRAVRHVRR